MKGLGRKEGASMSPTRKQREERVYRLGRPAGGRAQGAWEPDVTGSQAVLTRGRPRPGSRSRRGG